MITALLQPELVFADLDVRSKGAALEHLTQAIARRHPSVGADRLLRMLLEREAQASTALGDGIAIPHARIPGLETMIVAFARSRAGIDWDAPDSRPAHLIFLLAGPVEQPGTYLKTLSAASRLLRDGVVRTRLLDAPDARDLLSILHAQGALQQHAHETA